MKVTSSLILYLRGNNLEFGREHFCLLSTLRALNEIWFIRWSLRFFGDLATLYLTKENFHYSVPGRCVFRVGVCSGLVCVPGRCVFRVGVCSGLVCVPGRLQSQSSQGGRGLTQCWIHRNWHFTTSLLLITQKASVVMREAQTEQDDV